MKGFARNEKTQRIGLFPNLRSQFLLSKTSRNLQTIAQHFVIPHPNIKSTAQTALPRDLDMGFSVNVANLAYGYICSASVGNTSAEFFSGFGAAQLRAFQLPSAQLPDMPPSASFVWATEPDRLKKIIVETNLHAAD